MAYIHSTADCEPGAVIGEGTRIWRFVHIASGARIGSDCSIGQGCYVAGGGVLGNRVRLQNGVSVFDGVFLDDEVFCGPGVTFTNVRRPRAAYPKMGVYADTQVGRGATLGANCTVLCGLTLGAFCFVAAGAVVTKDVPPFALVAGVPAVQRGWVSRRGESLAFDDAGIAHCPASGAGYRLRDDSVTPLHSRD